MFISNNPTSFHLSRKGNLVKHQKVSKYFENDCRWLNNLYYLLAAQASSFFNLLFFLFFFLFFSLTGHHATSEVTTLISYNLCSLRDTVPRQKSPLSFPTQAVPREVEDFRILCKYHRNVLLPTFLAYLQPV